MRIERLQTEKSPKTKGYKEFSLRFINNSGSQQSVEFFNVADSDYLPTSKYQFTTPYTANYISGIQYRFSVNGTALDYQYLTSAKTPDELATLLTALGYGTWTVSSNVTSGNIFTVNPGSGVTITNLVIDIPDYSRISSGQANVLNRAFFVSENIGWYAGRNGTIIKTINGGASYSSQVSGTVQELKEPFFVSTLKGWIVGDAGVILYTTDGGINWNPQVSGVATLLRSVAFYNTLIGWAVGDAGVILKTTDGGANWNPQASGIVSSLKSISVVDDNTVYVVGRSGKALKTTDGGTNWTSLATGVAVDLNGVDFVDANNGFACGASGIVIKTTNGGISWASMTITGTALGDIKMFSTTDIWFGSSQNGIYRSIDGSTFFNLAGFPAGGVGKGMFVYDESLAFANDKSYAVKFEFI